MAENGAIRRKWTHLKIPKKRKSGEKQYGFRAYKLQIPLRHVPGDVYKVFGEPLHPPRQLTQAPRQLHNAGEGYTETYLVANAREGYDKA